MKIKSKILFLLFIFFLVNNNHLFCQQPIEKTTSTTLLLAQPNQTFSFSIFKPFNLYALTPTKSNQPNSLKLFMTSPSVKPPSGLYNQKDLAFFCRLEVKIENAAKLPVKFRLGDVQYVDYLEGKFEPWRYGY